MPTIRSRGWVAAPVDEAFAFFDDPANLARLMPPPVQIRVIRMEPVPPRAGTEIEFTYGLGPLRRRWLVRYVDYVAGRRIVDETVRGPVRHFRHQHLFTPGRHGTWIEDRIEYRVGPDGAIGAVVDAVAGIVVRLTFVWRHARQRRLLRG